MAGMSMYRWALGGNEMLYTMFGGWLSKLGNHGVLKIREQYVVLISRG